MKGSKETQIIKHPKKHAHHVRFNTNEQHEVYSLMSFSALVIIKGKNKNKCYWQSQVFRRLINTL